MTIKEIYEKAKSGELKLKLSYIQDFNASYCGDAELYLEMYKKASRKNAADKYRAIKALLDQEAVVIEDTDCAYRNFRYYEIVTRRTFEGAFGKPLKEYQKIIAE